MTSDISGGKHKLSAFLFLILAVSTFISLLLSPDIAIGYARSGLALCARTVIPSLFPFMVLSGLMVELGLPELLSRLFARPMKLLFGISGEGSAAPLMGAVCGFPVGALTAKRLFDGGRITKEEFVRLLTFSNNPSSAFLISAVGSALWSCPRFGIALYIIELLTAFVIGAVMHIMFPVKNSSLTVNVPTKKHMGVRVFSAVMTDSALSMINVCALVLFFASLVGASVSVAENFGVSQTAKTLLYGFFEMTGACGEAAKLQSKEAGLILTALICGWSGLSVHFQVISISASEGVSFLPYFCAKACQGVLSALSMLLYIRFFDSALPSVCIPALSVSGTSDKNSTAFTIAVNAVLGFSFLLYFTGRSRARISSVHDRVQTK